MLGSFIGKLLQEEPDVPKISPVDIGAEQKKALQANIQSFGLFRQLSDLAQQAALEQGMARVSSFLGPGTMEQIQQNIAAQARGQLPSDVASLIRRRSAEAATGAGVPPSAQFARNVTLRDLGLTSLQMTQAALDSATRWVSMMGGQAPQYSFANMFVTPAQYIQQANIERQQQFEREWMESQLRAAYDPMTLLGQSIVEFDRWAMDVGAGLIGIAAGGGFGGMPMPAGGAPPGGERSPVSPWMGVPGTYTGI